MRQASVIFTVTLASACLILAFSQAFASMPAVTQPYPPMTPGQGTGNVTARVTTFNTNEGIAGVYVAIVSASNTSIAYATGQTDSAGNCTFSGVNSTDGQPWYRVYANKSGFFDGFSNAFIVVPNDTAFAPVIAIEPRPTPTPSPTPAPNPVSSGTGHVSGRIKMCNGQPAPGVTITVVNTGNFDFAYGSATTDSNGDYAIDTTAVSTQEVFQLLVHKDGFGDAISLPFALASGASVTVHMTDNSIFPTSAPTASPTPGPSVTPKPTPGPTATATDPTPTVWQQPEATPTIKPTPTKPAATGTPVPGTSQAGMSTPGFEIALAVAGIAIALICGRKK